MGMIQDMKQRQTEARIDDEQRKSKVESARNIIYNKNYAVDSDAVEKILRDESLVPTIVSLISADITNLKLMIAQNAFSKRLGPSGLDMLRMFIVDLMHEFELGVWKAIFIHLLRILEAQDKALINELDRRYVD